MVNAIMNLKIGDLCKFVAENIHSEYICLILDIYGPLGPQNIILAKVYQHVIIVGLIEDWVYVMTIDDFICGAVPAKSLTLI